MRISALILGLIGGIGGFIAAIVVLSGGGIGSVFGAEGAETLIGQGWAAILISLIGIIGGALALSKPTVAGILLLISGIGGFIAIGLFYLFGGPLLIIGGIFALVARRSVSI